MFNTLCAQPTHNPLVMTAVNLALDFNINFRVFHLPGEDNIVADALSHFRNDTLATLVPHLRILHFLPPRLTLGEEQS
jgi:hypothetical protein